MRVFIQQGISGKTLTQFPHADDGHTQHGFFFFLPIIVSLIRNQTHYKRKTDASGHAVIVVNILRESCCIKPHAHKLGVNINSRNLCGSTRRHQTPLTSQYSSHYLPLVSSPFKSRSLQNTASATWRRTTERFRWEDQAYQWSMRII